MIKLSSTYFYDVEDSKSQRSIYFDPDAIKTVELVNDIGDDSETIAYCLIINNEYHFAYVDESERRTVLDRIFQFKKKNK